MKNTGGVRKRVIKLGDTADQLAAKNNANPTWESWAEAHAARVEYQAAIDALHEMELKAIGQVFESRYQAS